jgi:ETFB lysine methyltransferase
VLLPRDRAATIGRVSTTDSFAKSLNPAITELKARLRCRFQVVEQRVTIGGREFTLEHPRSADELIDEAEFQRDERLPYWAEIWPSAYVLAQRIAAEAPKSTGAEPRLLELGCGSGLVVLAAAAAGFSVTAVDYYREALDFVLLNAAENGLPTPEIMTADWRNYPASLSGFDAVVAADVLYERNYCTLVARAFKQSLKPDGLGLLTDPQRSKAAAFPEACRQAVLQISPAKISGPLNVPGGDPAVKQTVDLYEIRHAFSHTEK